MPGESETAPQTQGTASKSINPVPRVVSFGATPCGQPAGVLAGSTRLIAAPCGAFGRSTDLSRATIVLDVLHDRQFDGQTSAATGGIMAGARGLVQSEGIRPVDPEPGPGES